MKNEERISNEEIICVLGLPLLIILCLWLSCVIPQIIIFWIGMVGMAFSGFGFAIILARHWNEEGKRKG